MDQQHESLDSAEDNSMSFRSILDALMENKELIVTVRESDVPLIKRNLTSLKGRDVQKLKSAGIEPGDDVLSYAPVMLDKGSLPPGTIKLRITLAPRKGVPIFGIELPDPDL